MTAVGYQYQPRTYVLRFDEYPGLEIECRMLSTGDMLMVQEAAQTKTPEEWAKLGVEIFGRTLASWNLEIDEVPVPATEEGLRRIDPTDVLAWVTGWLGEITRAAGQTPKPAPVPAGIEESIRMDQAPVGL